MQLRAYVLPSISESKSAYSASDRDLTLLVSHDHTVEEVKLAAGGHIASSTFEVDLNEGSVAHYPLDSYVARLGVEFLTESPRSGSRPRSRRGRGCSGMVCIQQASPEPIRTTSS